MSARPNPQTRADLRGIPHPNAPRLALDVPEELIEAVAQRAAAIVLAAQAPVGSPWLSTEEAAEHLRCPRSRIHDLTALGKLTPRRDGRRLLFRRDDLDAYIEASA
jgi:excisionase family DNA binding protein